jgi:transposase
MRTFKRHKDYVFDYIFGDHDLRQNKISKLSNPLEKLHAGVDFEVFREIFEDELNKEPESAGGRRPYDYVLMFKTIIFQRYYNLSDEQIKFQINDRLSFIRFLNLTISGTFRIAAQCNIQKKGEKNMVFLEILICNLV